MADVMELVIEVKALRVLVGLDCSTPRCGARAYATGRLVRWSLIGWTLEAFCPECKDEMHVGSSVIEALGKELEPLKEVARDRVARAWTTPRRGNCQPWR